MLRKNELVSVVKEMLLEAINESRPGDPEDFAREIVNTVLRMIQDNKEPAPPPKEANRNVHWRDIY
jgi:hypothetical protein